MKTDRAAKLSPADALSSLNAKARRKKNAVAMIEASIESKAKKRRQREKPVSSALK